MQDLLFGTEWDESPNAAPSTRLRIAALNVQGGPAARTVPLMRWVAAAKSDVLVLSELRLSNVDRIASELRALRYDVQEPDSAGNDLSVLIATAQQLAATPHPGMDRVSVSRIGFDAHEFYCVGVYGPTNGMTAESSAGRAAWQRQFLRFLQAMPADASIVVTGDLNVLERGHSPASPFFEEHDYEFYEAMLAAGLRDCYRQVRPEGADHSWFSPRYGSQRLDHTFVSDSLAGAIEDCHYDAAPINDKVSDHRAMLTDIRRDQLQGRIPSDDTQERQ